jgi:hypothetical protein
MHSERRVAWHGLVGWSWRRSSCDSPRPHSSQLTQHLFDDPACRLSRKGWKCDRCLASLPWARAARPLGAGLHCLSRFLSMTSNSTFTTHRLTRVGPSFSRRSFARASEPSHLNGSRVAASLPGAWRVRLASPYPRGLSGLRWSPSSDAPPGQHGRPPGRNGRSCRCPRPSQHAASMPIPFRHAQTVGCPPRIHVTRAIRARPYPALAATPTALGGNTPQIVPDRGPRPCGARRSGDLSLPAQAQIT